MAKTYNPPPNWPRPPQGWRPPPGWMPDPRWGPLPPGWRLWREPNPIGAAMARAYICAVAVLIPLSVFGFAGGALSVHESGEWVVACAVAPAGIALLARVSGFRWGWWLYLLAVLLAAPFVFEWLLMTAQPRR